jgi:hypothetical protein
MWMGIKSQISIFHYNIRAVRTVVIRSCKQECYKHTVQYSSSKRQVVQDHDEAKTPTPVRTACEQQRQRPKWISQRKEIARLCHLCCGRRVFLRLSSTELSVDVE